MFCFWASFPSDVSCLGTVNAKGGKPWLACDLSCDLILQHKWRCCEKLWLWKFRKFSGKNYGVCLNKIASLCCINCNYTITRTHCRFFSEYVSKSYIPYSTTKVSARFYHALFAKLLSIKFRKSFCEISLSFLI